MREILIAIRDEFGNVVRFVRKLFKDIFETESDVSVTNRHIQPPSRPASNFNDGIGVKDSKGFNLSVLLPFMLQYGVDINNVDALSLLVQKIDTAEYKNLLQMFQRTKSASELISILDNYDVPETIEYAKNPKKPNGPFVSEEKVSRWLNQYKIKIPNLNSIDKKVDALLTYAFTNPFTSLQSQLGSLFQKMISAHNNGEDAEPYYKEIMKEINSYVEFLS